MVTRNILFNSATVAANFTSNEFFVETPFDCVAVMFDFTAGTEIKLEVYVDYRPDNSGIATEWYDVGDFDRSTGEFVPFKIVLDADNKFVFKLPVTGKGIYRLRGVGDTIGMVPGSVTAYISTYKG